MSRPRTKTVLTDRAIQRAIRAARKAGINPTSVEVDPNTGKIILHIGQGDVPGNHDVEQWVGKHARKAAP
jgi:hypothetical protein